MTTNPPLPPDVLAAAEALAEECPRALVLDLHVYYARHFIHATRGCVLCVNPKSSTAKGLRKTEAQLALDAAVKAMREARKKDGGTTP